MMMTAHNTGEGLGQQIRLLYHEMGSYLRDMVYKWYVIFFDVRLFRDASMEYDLFFMAMGNGIIVGYNNKTPTDSTSEMGCKTDYLLFNTEDTMGNFETNNGMGHKSSKNGDVIFHNYGNWRDHVVHKRHRTKSEKREIMFRAIDILGITAGGYTLVSRIDSLQEAIVFIVVTLWALTRYYFYVRRQIRLERREIFEQQQREKNNK